MQTKVKAHPPDSNDKSFTTATTCFFMNDGDWNEHRAYRKTRKYTANSDECMLRLFKSPYARPGDRCDEQIQFRAGATIFCRRAFDWAWQTREDRRLLFVFDDADVIARPDPEWREDSYDACYQDNPQMWS